MPIQSVNPANEILLHSYSPVTRETLSMKVSAAQEAFGRYRRKPVEHRAMWLKKLAGILEHEMEELATLLTSETGKTIRSSRQEILDCASYCRLFAAGAADVTEKEALSADMSRRAVAWEPLGVVVGVAPAPRPMWQAIRFLVPVLLAGNTILLHHDASVPQCAKAIELLVLRAGFPREVFQTLLMKRTDLTWLLNDKRVAGVLVNDSVMTGRGLGAKVSASMKIASLDEEGSNAFVVMPSVNLLAAIEAGVAARCVADPDHCAGATRFVVHEGIYGDFELLFSAAMEEVQVGNPCKDDTAVGPVSTEKRLRELEALVAAAVKAGGRIVSGGGRMVGEGNFFEPTVIADLAPDAKICHMKIAEPIALLFKVSSLEKAISVANEVPDSRGVSVWTQEQGEQEEFIARLECAQILINTPVVDESPVGWSEGQLGTGHQVAEESMAEVRRYMRRKTVVVTERVNEAEILFEFDLDAGQEPAAEQAAKAAAKAAAERIVEELVADDSFDLESLLEEAVFQRSAPAIQVSRPTFRKQTLTKARFEWAKVSITTLPIMEGLKSAVKRMNLSDGSFLKAMAPRMSLKTIKGVLPGRDRKLQVVNTPDKGSSPELNFQQMFEKALQMRP